MARRIKPPSFQFYPRDFLASRAVRLMCPAARGGFITLLCHAWLSEKPGTLPDDDTQLAALSELWSQWPDHAPAIRAAFRAANGLLIQERMLAERALQRGRFLQTREAGRLSGYARRLKASNEKGTSVERNVNGKVNETGTPASASASAFASAENLEPTPFVNGVDGGGDSSNGETRITARQAFSEHFWPAYPRKVNRAEAEREFLKLVKDDSDDLFDSIMQGLAWYKHSEWPERLPDKIPHASTWLHQGRWKDAENQAH